MALVTGVGGAATGVGAKLVICDEMLLVSATFVGLRTYIPGAHGRFE